MSVIDTLITDRTQADVDYLKALLATGWQNMSVEEKTAFLAWNLKGAYNASDLNRVESAVDYIADALIQAPVDLINYANALDVAWDVVYDLPYNPADFSDLTIKTDWTVSDIPLVADMTRYLDNIVLLRSALDVDYTAIPETMNNLNYDGANRIERLLTEIAAALDAEIERIETLIDHASEAWFFSGDLYSGEI